jgi:hypothetical protein
MAAVNYRRANELMLLIAANPATPETVLKQLATEDDPLLLEQIAENPAAPIITLAHLAGHANERIRVAVSHNPKTPIEIIYTLIYDISADVRYALASNPLLPLQVIEEVCQDENPYVASRAHQTYARLTQERTPRTNIAITLQNIQFKKFTAAS